MYYTTVMPHVPHRHCWFSITTQSRTVVWRTVTLLSTPVDYRDLYWLVTDVHQVKVQRITKTLKLKHLHNVGQQVTCQHSLYYRDLYWLVTDVHQVKVQRQVLSTFTHGQSTDSEGLVLVTDCDNLTDLQSDSKLHKEMVTWCKFIPSHMATTRGALWVQKTLLTFTDICDYRFRNVWFTSYLQSILTNHLSHIVVIYLQFLSW